ncbi:unnamed protein product, partial [Discosporangium mesarthrocarpum]
EHKREKVESRNSLETYLYNLKAAYEDTLKDRLSDEDREELKTTVEAALEWMDSNPAAESEECDHKQKEVEGIANPIMSRAYASGQGGEGGGGDGGSGFAAGDEGAEGGDDEEPQVEEVD